MKESYGTLRRGGKFSSSVKIKGESCGRMRRDGVFWWSGSFEESSTGLRTDGVSCSGRREWRRVFL